MEDCLNPTDVMRPKNTKLFGERSHRGEGYSYKNGGSLSSSPSKDVAAGGSELRFARRDEMARLKSELSEARKLAEALASQVGESEARARARKREIEEVVLWTRNSSKGRRELVNGDVGRDWQMELERELEDKKRELSNLRVEMASVVAEKARAEEATKAAHARRRSSQKTIERLGKEIDEADEEEVLIELARIEAIKEAKEIEAQREVEAARHSQKLNESKARIAKMKKELAHARKIEKKLAVTSADVDVLQNEMMFVRAMEKKNASKSSSEKDAEKDLRSARAELEAAKEELEAINEVGFKYMASMDSIREKMRRISGESSRLRKLQEEADARVRDLNAELLRAHGELEAASAEEERSQETLSDLSISLANLKRDKEKATEERERAEEGARRHLEVEIPRCNSSIDVMKEGLVAAMHELESIKSSEAAALDKLRSLCERAASEAAKATLTPSRGRGASITVSRFEYEYLRKGAEGAREVAAKKVEAARAWVEAFGASEEEVAMETERVRRELEGLGGVEGEPKGCQEEEKALQWQAVKRIGWLPGGQEEEEAETLVPSRRSVKENARSRRSSLQRRSNLQRRSISGQARARPPSITLRRRRRKVMRDLARFLGGSKERVQELSAA